MKFLRKILFPFSILYGLILRLRNLAYNASWIASEAFDLPIICVGNLSVGGTGKSPAIEYLIRLLNQQLSVATLSRGYGRKSSGFIEVQSHHSTEEVGDEPLQFKNKFPQVIVAVDEQRVRGVRHLIQQKKPGVILLDDAFQHRKIRAGLNILLSVYHDLYCTDWVLPTGNLREPSSGANRADIIVITKCPPYLSKADQQHIINKIKPLPHQQVFFSCIAYSNTIFSLSKKYELTNLHEYTLVTGIANPTPLVDYLKKIKPPKKHLSFSDHHHFTPKEIKHLKEEAIILTTEKDFMRLKGELNVDKLFYLPIEMKILDKQKVFDEAILNYVAPSSSHITNN